MADGLLPLADAHERLLALVAERLPPVEHVLPLEALGRYTAEPIIAARSQPSANLSAMDGYAVAGAQPWRIIGESRCGAAFAGSVREGEAVRISTGAIVPDGAARVVLQENVARDGTALTIAQAESPHHHIRKMGEDFQRGTELFQAGAHLGPAQLALLLTAQAGPVAVRRRPSLAVLECGDELVVGRGALTAEQLPASNGAMLAAMCMELADPIHHPAPVPDRIRALCTALDAHRHADLLVISGGASVGDHDLVRPALERLGVTLDFWRIAIKPGKPLLVATRQNQIIIGLPGNPVSSFVTGWLIVLPALRAILGAAKPVPRPVHMPCATALPRNGARRTFLRARMTAQGPVTLDAQQSSMLASLAAADCLIERPEHSAAIDAGEQVPVYLLRNGAIA